MNQENYIISRFGANKVEEYLPKLIKAIKKEGTKVIWSCDPMHIIQSKQRVD